jgi:hypothetical protein
VVAVLSAHSIRRGATPSSQGRTALHRAWWSLLLFPVSFVAAMVLGEGIPAWLGYREPSLDTTPWWVIGLAVLVAFVVFALPALVVVHFGRRATAWGQPDGRSPIVVGLVVAGAFVVLNLASGLMQLILG